MKLRRKIFLLLFAGMQFTAAAKLEHVCVSKDGKGFATASGVPFIVWGVNYDHDENKRLLEDYWVDEWATVVADFMVD